MALVTLAEGKAHLRLTTPPGDPGDADLTAKLAAAEAVILGYIGTTPEYRTIAEAWTAGDVPLEVKQAILLQLGELYRFRGDDLPDESAPRDVAWGDLSPAIVSLLRRRRRDVVA